MNQKNEENLYGLKEFDDTVYVKPTSIPIKIYEGFKLVKVEGDKLVSATFDAEKTEYIINEWIKPLANCGPLTCFSELKYLIKFISNNSYWIRGEKLAIFKCEYVRSKRRTVWLKQDSRKYYTKLKCLPSGSVLADSLILREILPQISQTNPIEKFPDIVDNILPVPEST